MLSLFTQYNIYFVYFWTASGYNGHENGKDSDDNVKQVSKNRNDHHEKASPVIKTEPKEVNGNYSGSKRKYHSSEVSILNTIISCSTTK